MTNALRKALQIACTLLFLCALSFAQQTQQPFANVDAAFKKSRLNWSRASEPFQQERTRLGQNFEPELWKYLGDDVDKQDKISNFLLYPEYLHGNLPMPYLAMQIQLKSLATLRGKPDLSSRIMYVTTSINAAILDGSLGLLDEAQAHKTEAETMMAKDKFLTHRFSCHRRLRSLHLRFARPPRDRETRRQLVPQRKPLVSQTSRSSKSPRYRTRSSPRTRSHTGLRRQKVRSLAPSLSKF